MVRHGVARDVTACGDNRCVVGSGTESQVTDRTGRGNLVADPNVYWGVSEESCIRLVDIAGTFEALLYAFPEEDFIHLAVKAPDRLSRNHPAWVIVDQFLATNCHVLLCEDGGLTDDEQYFGGEVTEYAYRVWQNCPGEPGKVPHRCWLPYLFLVPSGSSEV